MKSLSSIGLGLSIVFCCLLLGLVVEVYYFLWWKKRLMNREIENDHGNPIKNLFYMFCHKNPTSSTSTSTCFTSQEHCSSMIIGNTLFHHDLEEAQQVVQSSQNSKEFLFKPFGEESNNNNNSNGLDSSEFMLGHQRFLFTIVEESKEDLESEDGRKTIKGSSLSDLLVVETPYLTPNVSPSFFTPISPYNKHRLFNPLFESTNDAEFIRMKSSSPSSSSLSSPPPKFKFLQEAEEKLRRKLKDDEKNKR